MAHLINKDALVAEIARQKAQWRICKSSEAKYRREMLDDISFFLDTLEVKEVDLEKEIKEQSDKYYSQCEKKLQEMDDNDKDLSFLSLDNFAKHFFELGMQVSSKEQKGEKV